MSVAKRIYLDWSRLEGLPTLQGFLMSFDRRCPIVPVKMILATCLVQSYKIKTRTELPKLKVLRHLKTSTPTANA